MRHSIVSCELEKPQHYLFSVLSPKIIMSLLDGKAIHPGSPCKALYWNMVPPSPRDSILPMPIYRKHKTSTSLPRSRTRSSSCNPLTCWKWSMLSLPVAKWMKMLTHFTTIAPSGVCPQRLWKTTEIWLTATSGPYLRRMRKASLSVGSLSSVNNTSIGSNVLVWTYAQYL